MSVQVDVASSLLKETFGELVQKVGSYLMHHGGLALGELVKGTKLKPNQVRVYALCMVSMIYTLCQFSCRLRSVCVY